MADMTLFAIGVFLAVVGMNAWSHFPPDFAHLAQQAVSRKAIFLTVSGAALSIGGAVRALIRVRGDKQ